jgi:hypothetical protein
LSSNNSGPISNHCAQTVTFSSNASSGSKPATQLAPISKKHPQQQFIQNATSSTNGSSSSLGEFFELLNFDNMGQMTSTISPASGQQQQQRDSTNGLLKSSQNGKETTADSSSGSSSRTSSNSSENSSTTVDEPVSGQTGNLSETTANLELSLKNSAEILRNLSFAGKIENLQQLELQMQQSMQLVEKLKSASKQQHQQESQQQQQQQPKLNGKKQGQQLKQATESKVNGKAGGSSKQRSASTVVPPVSLAEKGKKICFY